MRQLIILTKCLEQIEPHYFSTDVPILPHKIAFTNAKTLLGQEFPFAIYDMRSENGVCLHLESLAIVAGTIQSGGFLLLLCPHWHNLEMQLDDDAKRWNGQQAICCPHFYRYFKQLIAEFDFAIDPAKLPTTSGQNLPNFCQFTPEQQYIFTELPRHSAQIHILTAPRGRGKSTLAGKLAEQIAKSEVVYLTARSHSALANFYDAKSNHGITFLPPDQLLTRIEQKSLSPHSWLFIDEAASLPLPLLNKYCQFFDKLVLTTTTQNYEGTGRGFVLKFTQTIAHYKMLHHWQLTQPLRWQPNDRLEHFIHRLLLLEGSTAPSNNEKAELYQLLANAHYKTTPTDLRRLLDAPDQHFYTLKQHQQLIGAIWAINEGGFEADLIEAIWRGERRPFGNLVAQYLCFHGNLPQACLLRSIRISRIAIHPPYQQQGYGKQLVIQFLQKFSQQRPLVDFISVSFGLNDSLFSFWQSCGFKLVQITPTAEASSGLHSAMMIFPLSEQGTQFAQHAQRVFQRNLPLQPSNNHTIIIPQPITAETIKLDHDDWQNLYGFLFAQRSLSACYISLKRLYLAYPQDLSLLTDYFQHNQIPQNKKLWISNIKKALHQLNLFQVM